MDSFNNRQKNKLQNIAFKAVLFSIPLLALILVSNSGGRSGFNTGSPGENGNTCAQCHKNNPQDYSANLTIATTIPEGGYELNTSYDITVDISSTASRHGFQIVAERLSDDTDIGTFSAGSNSQLVDGGVHVTHDGFSSTNWTFSWTSPSSDEGPIKFYAAAVAGNGGGNGSDQVVTTQSEASDILGVSATESTPFQMYPNPVVDDLYIDIPQNSASGKYAIYDLNGKEISTGTLTQTDTILSLTTLQTGMYVIELTVDSKTYRQEFIKQ